MDMFVAPHHTCRYTDDGMVNNLIKTYDQDGNGKLNLEEFTEMCRQCVKLSPDPNCCALSLAPQPDCCYCVNGALAFHHAEWLHVAYMAFACVTQVEPGPCESIFDPQKV